MQDEGVDMKKLLLRSSDEVRVIAPSCSMRKIDSSVIERAQERFRCLGLNVAFGDHV